jgi:hypothetical protein
MGEIRSWGAFLSYFQDNGSFERGFLLGNTRNQFAVGVSTNGSASLNYLKAPEPYNLNQWYWVTATYNGNDLKLFIDGKLVNKTGVNSGEIKYAKNGWFTVGRYKDENEDITIHGKLDEIMLLKTALTDEEVLNKYKAYLKK